MDDAFRFAYEPGTLRYGQGCVDSLASELASEGCDRGLVVCGQTVGATSAVMDPIEAGLGEKFAGVFDRTTPAKRLSTAIEAADALQDRDADALVAVGGGSSLDVAKVASVVAASDHSPAELADQLAAGVIAVPDGELTPVFAVPTTLAGADLSVLGGITASPDSGLVDSPASGGVMDARLMPAAAFYDPDLLATTPRDILAGSAMNGFDKGIETLYARNRTPVTDATARRGLELLGDGLPTLAEDRETDLATILQGTMLVQYGISRPAGTTLSVIHAFGHGLTAHADIQQGIAHAVVAPHALAYLFEHVDARRRLLADALGVPTDGKDDVTVAEGVLEAVRDVRDALDVPTRLRETAVDRSALPAIAETTSTDYLLGNAPPGLEVSAEDLEDVLDAAW